MGCLNFIRKLKIKAKTMERLNKFIHCNYNWK